MKSFGSLVVPAAFVAVLASCGGGGDSTPDEGSGTDIPPATNTAPAISDFSATPINIRSNESVLFEWIVVDNDLSTLNCALDVDSDGTTEFNLDSCDATGSVSYTFVDSGSFSSTLVVTDASGLTATASTTVAVSPADGSVPVIDSLEVSESPATAGTPVAISWMISSVDDDATVSCALDAEGDGAADYEFDPCPLSGSQLHTYTLAADVSPRLTVTTMGGAIATDTLALSVQSDGSPTELNRPPIVASFDATPGAVMIDQVVTMSWDISDPDGDSLTCEIDTDGDGASEITVENCATGQSVEHFYLVPQRYEPVLTVRDSEGLEVQTDTAVTVLPLQVDLAVAETAVAGQRVRYEFTVSNVSLVPVTGVEMLFRVPAGLSFARSGNAVPGAIGCSVTCVEGVEAEWNFASIPAGASRSVVLDALVADSNASGVEIDNRIVVTADAFTQTIAVEKAIVVENQPSAEIVVAALQDPVQPGERVTVHIDVGNISSVNLSDVVVRSNLPRDVVADAISDGGLLDESSGEVVWNLPELSVLTTRQLSLDLLVPASAVPGQILAIQSSISQSGVIEPTAGLTDIVTVTDQRSPLQVDFAQTGAPVPAGGRANYQITVSNVGLVPINSAAVQWLVPAGLVFGRSNDAQPNASGCSVNCVHGVSASWSFNSLPAGSSQTITVNANVQDSLQAGSLIESLFYVSSSNASNVITKRSAIGINNSPDSQLALGASVDPVVAGQEFEVSIDAGNVSSGNLENATVTLAVPAGVTVTSISGTGAQSGEDGIIRWPAQTLPVLSSQGYSANITTPGDAVPGEVLFFRSTLEHDGGLVVDAKAEQVVTVVESQPALRLEISPASQTVSGGGRLRYDLLVTNDALIPVQNTAVLFRVPDGVSFLRSTDADPDASGCSVNCIAGVEASWLFPSIQPGETVTISINSSVSDQLQAGNLINSVVEVRADGLNDTIHLSSVVVVN